MKSAGLGTRISKESLLFSLGVTKGSGGWWVVGGDDECAGICLRMSLSIFGGISSSAIDSKEASEILGQ